ncbi:hypothetical protein RM553_01210 [Zunongwangia sp. F363]|uniref:Phage protein n=1 Tax=Autumnicola tepida TaxID=3075595 RepID=A0ABU3C518_9FLAO|nr:hypothetical protein [Zunongwangia sp. F363]MDT0641437.1 hypothetical protein [Zunongwangia sp. F363]
MEELKIDVKNNGEVVGFKIDSEVMKDLWLTHTKEKVDANIRNFAIDIEVSPNGIATKISKIDEMAVLTLIANSERKYQYVVGKDLEMDKVANMDSHQVPDQIKGLIRQTYDAACA